MATSAAKAGPPSSEVRKVLPKAAGKAKAAAQDSAVSKTRKAAPRGKRAGADDQINNDVDPQNGDFDPELLTLELEEILISYDAIRGKNKHSLSTVDTALSQFRDLDTRH